jgi:hypothetical protein
VSDEHTHDAVVRDALSRAESAVQRSLAGFGICPVGVGTVLQQELREPPVAMEAGAGEAKIGPEPGEHSAVIE